MHRSQIWFHVMRFLFYWQYNHFSLKVSAREELKTCIVIRNMWFIRIQAWESIAWGHWWYQDCWFWMVCSCSFFEEEYVVWNTGLSSSRDCGGTSSWWKGWYLEFEGVAVWILGWNSIVWDWESYCYLQKNLSSVWDWESYCYLQKKLSCGS